MWWRSKGIISIYTHIHVYAPHNVCREIATSMQGNGNDQLFYRGLYVLANELWRAEANWLAGMQELNYFGADVGCEWRIIPAHKLIYILLPVVNNILSGLLTRLLVPRPRRDRDCSRHNPRRDRDETFVIRGETEMRPRRLYKRPRRDVCFIASSITWDHARCMCSNAL